MNEVSLKINHTVHTLLDSEKESSEQKQSLEQLEEELENQLITFQNENEQLNNERKSIVYLRFFHAVNKIFIFFIN